ncbi:probable cytochrome P450 6a14 [Osmia bicornis bicornis]|uniref:Cytochrome P450 mono-oxygenase n=1 Tax=Osmia rufa TaxID=1437190 RepID=A0A411K6Y2_OSMRU|nr:probable cytochrome P450 6a14 [Osmia bicornis bicornis]QBC73090.1 cytochrome P450 mono-oxygenase [Osmia bicornis]
MSWPLFEAAGLLAAILFLLYYYSTSLLQYWEKRGAKGPKPIPFLGNFKDMFLGKSSFNDCIIKAYYEFKDEPLIGVFSGHIPILIVRDPDLMKDVLIKDFSKFADRMTKPNEEIEPFSLHLFRLDGKRWKPLRTRFSPVFSSGKLKEMFYLILECGNHFEKYLDTMVSKEGNKGAIIDCRDISAKFTTDVIGSCAFGIEMNALAAEDSEFREMGKRVFQTSWKTVLRDRLREYPFLFKIFARFILDYEIVDFFTRITKESIDYRIKHNVHRHDFIDVLVDLKQNPGKIELEDFNDLFLTAQAFVFFAAGFETSSVTITNALYELALNPSIQEKVRTEIQNVLKRNNGEITYDSIKEMKYLDAVFQETLRKYPVVLWLSRKATTNYTFSGTKVNIEKGQLVILPVFAIQRDPDIFPDPEVFDPNRFTDESAKTRHPMLFLPFGDGPRNCIGARFAKIQSKIAMIKFLSNFKVDVCEQTVKTYEIEKKSLLLLQPSHEVNLRITKI